jgi:hypothetical protein
MAAAEQVVNELILRAKTEGFERAIAQTDTLTKSQESAMKAAEKQVRALDAEAKSMHQLEQVARTYVALQRQGMGNTELAAKHLQALTTATERHTRAFNDNQGALRTHEWVNFSRQLQDVAVGLYSGQHAMTIFAQQGVQMYDVLASRQGGFMSGLKALGGSLASMITPMRLFGGAVVGAFAAIEVGASMAQAKLAALGSQSRRTGIGASGIVGARGVGAGAGLTSEETDSALASASKQFEQFKRNSGDVLEFFKKFDAAALPAIDKARGFREWIGAIGQEAQKLGGEKGMDLAQRLLGEDQGRLLADNMDKFVKSLSDVPDQIDGAASRADAFVRHLAEANDEVDKKMLTAFSEIAALSSDISNTWLSIKSAFADVVSFAGQAYNKMRSFIPDWTSPTGFLLPTAQLPDITVGGEKKVGATRAMYPDTKKSGKSDAEREQEKYDKTVADLQQQIRLVNAVGDAHKQVQWEIEKENWLEKLGADASKEHKQNVLNLAETLRLAREEQEKLNEKVKNFNEAYSAAAGTVSGALKDIIHGGKPGDALKKGLDSFGDSAIDAVLTGSGPLAKMFGMDNKTGGVGGIFGGIASMFGLGGKEVQTQTMNVNAASVNVSGAGDLLGGAEGIGKAAGGIRDFFKGIFNFADGGIMTGAGPVPLRKYAGGGVANSPQLALFGEGSTPEAFVPVPSGRIPVEMSGGGGARITINQNASGVEVSARQMSDGEIMISVDRKIARAVSRVPGMMADQERRRA